MKISIISLAMLALGVGVDARLLKHKEVVSESSPGIKLRAPLAQKIMQKSRELQDQGYNYNANQYNGNQYNANQYNGNQYNANQYNGNQYNGNNAYNGYVENYNGNGNNYNQYYGNSYNDAFQEYVMKQHAWITDYSLKFQGCHRVSQWNYDVDNEFDERILTRMLVSFRMCPTNTCSSSSNGGCDSGYGDYVVDLGTFLEAYQEAKETYEGWMQDYGDNNGNNWYDYNQQGWNGDADIDDYLQCQESDIQIDVDNFDNYWYGNDQQEEQQYDGNYFIGPYCSEQGGSISVGLYKDEECSVPADNNGGNSIYYSATGQNLPFSSGNMVQSDCIPCSPPRDYNNWDGEDEEEVEVGDFCEALYSSSGKCESELPAWTATYPNSQACNYFGGLQQLRDDGTVLTTNRAAPGHVSGSNKAAAVFISLFSVATVLLGAYVYYLKSKLDRASVNLGD